KNAARRVSPTWRSRTACGSDGNVWKWSGRLTSFTAFQSGSQQGCHIGSMSQEHESSTPRIPSFATRWVSRTAASMSPYGRHARETARPLRIVPAEVHEPVVVDAEHLARDLVVAETRRSAQDAEHHLGIHSILFHLGDPEVRVGWPPDGLLGVIEQARGRHHV